MNRGEPIARFFNAYPNDDVLKNEAEVKDRLIAMRSAVSDLRVSAVENKSVRELADVHTLQNELARIELWIQFKAKAPG